MIWAGERLSGVAKILDNIPKQVKEEMDASLMTPRMNDREQWSEPHYQGIDNVYIVQKYATFKKDIGSAECWSV
jgi:hypothetical protein